MATFTATANSSSTIGYAQYGSTTWNKGTTNGACQGAYQGTTASKSRVGVMVFSGAGAALRGKIITQITLKITCSAAGSASTSKKLSFRRANYQTLQTGIAGSAQVGAALGTLTGKFYNNTVTHTLECYQQRRAVCSHEELLCRGQFCAGALQRRDVRQQ